MNRSHYPDRNCLVDLALVAGEIMRKAFAPGMKREWKEDCTPVTESDIAINRLVIEQLERDYPHITVIGEEKSRIVEDGEYYVLVDPIDGTIPFCCGIPASTFCISVIRNRVPIVAVIHDPYCNRTWSAEKGWGAMLNGEPVRVSEQGTLAQSTVSIIWWKGSIGNLNKVCDELVERNAKWLNLCSVAIIGGLISSGDMTASIFSGLKAWETAAMQLLVEEAGGVATDLYGNKLVYGPDLCIPGHVMSNRHIHDDLLAMIARANPA